VDRSLPVTSRFTTAYAGLSQVIKPDGLYRSQQRFGMYRWHYGSRPVPERPARDHQALGWRTHGTANTCRCRDDIASVVFWYQTLPTRRSPTSGSRLSRGDMTRIDAHQHFWKL
jgi:hypothetical protein